MAGNSLSAARRRRDLERKSSRRERVLKDMAQRLFIWKNVHDTMLLREVVIEVPHKHKPGSKERGLAWDRIAEKLKGNPEMRVTKRSCRERFDKLYKDFKRRESQEKKDSGTEVEYDEIHQALTDIHELITDYEEERGEKEKKEKDQAEEMRRRAAERLGETKKRKQMSNDDDDNDDDDEEESGPTPKKRRSTASMSDLLEQCITRKKKENEAQQVLRERELDVQQQFQAMMLQQHQQVQQQLQHQQLQQQQFQQQQQAMHFSMVQTLAELLKKN